MDAKPPKRACVTTKEFEGLETPASEIKFKISKS